MITKEQIVFIAIYNSAMGLDFKENDDEYNMKDQIIYYSGKITFINECSNESLIDTKLKRKTDDLNIQLKNVGLVQAFDKFIKL